MIKKIAKVIWNKLKPSTRLKIVRVTQKKFTISVAAVVVNENAEVLLLDHVFRAGSSWGLPGGFINAGEQPEEALRREIREEINLELENIKMIRIRTTNRHVEILFRANPIGTARVRSLEINELGWFGIGKMPEKMSRAQKSIIENLLISKNETENL